MVAHVSWGSKDTYHLSHCGIKCLALKSCTCLFCNSGVLDNRTPEWSQNKVVLWNDVVVNLWRVLCCWSVTSLASFVSKDISFTCNARYIKIKSRTEHAHFISYLSAFTEKGWIGFPWQRHSIKGEESFTEDIQVLIETADGTNPITEVFIIFMRLHWWINH